MYGAAAVVWAFVVGYFSRDSMKTSVKQTLRVIRQKSSWNVLHVHSVKAVE